MLSLLKEAKITTVSAAVAAGTTDVNSASVDMSGFDAVAFIAQMGAITSTAVTSIKLQGSTDDSAWVDLEGTAITIADDDDGQVFAAEILRPTYRYVRAVIDRGTANAVLDAIIAIQHTPRFTPVTQPATTTVEVSVSPPTGTA